jgi:orotidine-5'-phosphate decarboxylase
MTPKEAIRKGADYIVIGRAILSQPDPIKALERIHKEMDINK